MSGAVPKIRLRGLSKAFGPKQVLDGVDLDIRAGHGMVILGGSGSGKSVTIKCILGLIEPDAGSIEIDGQDILKLPRREREALNDRIGMLFQNGALFDSLPAAPPPGNHDAPESSGAGWARMKAAMRGQISSRQRRPEKMP